MKSILIIFLFLLGGAGFGYLYYTFFGCTGSCPITSDPIRTMIYFGLIGGLVGMISLPDQKKAQ